MNRDQDAQGGFITSPNRTRPIASRLDGSGGTSSARGRVNLGAMPPGYSRIGRGAWSGNDVPADYTPGRASQDTKDVMLAGDTEGDPFRAMIAVEQQLGIAADAIGGVIGRLAEEEKAAAKKAAAESATNPPVEAAQPTSPLGPDNAVRQILEGVAAGSEDVPTEDAAAEPLAPVAAGPFDNLAQQVRDAALASTPAEAAA
jgi:hypothetical protein